MVLVIALARATAGLKGGPEVQELSKLTSGDTANFLKGSLKKRQ